jgi:hypothetical protein
MRPVIAFPPSPVQVDGKLFDTNVIQPDVLVDAVPEYFTGGRDNALEEAVKRILKK